MDQLEDFSDGRKYGGCIHCGGVAVTKDHAPSQVFLDRPHPEYLPILPSCLKCNNELSKHEEYMACLVDCIIAGNVEKVAREKVKKALAHAPALAARIQASCQLDETGAVWSPEMERLQSVVLKCARGHAVYEHSEWRRQEPNHLAIFPLPMLTEAQRNAFEGEFLEEVALWPEIGTRAMQRLMLMNNVVFREAWVEVQEGRYRYYVDYDGLRLVVRMVFSEYLGAEVIWESIN